MPIIKACNTETQTENTGKQCDVSIVAPAMFIAVPPSLEIDDTDLEDPIAFFTPLLHASKSQRIYPLFGQNAPINTVTNSAEGDVTITLDDGTVVFLRYGIYNRTFETIKGGLPYAKALQSLNAAGYRIIEIDQQGHVILRVNNNGTYSGLIQTFMYSPSPILPDFKNNPYKNRFQISISPVELVKFGRVFSGGEELLSMMGLQDVAILKGATPATTTKIYVDVKTTVSESDLVSIYGADLAKATLFTITNKATGVVVVPSGVAVAGGQIEFTGVFATGQTFHVVGKAPSVWYASTPKIEGYDGSENGVDILIP